MERESGQSEISTMPNPAGAGAKLQSGTGTGGPVEAGEKGQVLGDAAQWLAPTLANLADGFVIFDREWRFVFVNAPAARMLRKTPEEMLGRVIWEIFPELVESPAYQNFHRAMADNLAVQFEQYSPGWGWYENRCHPTADRLAVYFSDITERKRAEQALQTQLDERARAQDAVCQSRAQAMLANSELEARVEQQTARLAELRAELKEISYSIIHDLRAPLRAISGFSELVLAESRDRLSERSNDFLRRIAEACQRMDHLLRDALAFNMVLQHELPLGPVDAGALLRGMVAGYPQFQAPGAEIRIEGSFPRVLANEGGLTQCFSHLLDNALKFVKTGTVPRVTIRAERVEGGKVRVWFEDNGIGVPEECQESIFLMFRQEVVGCGGTGIGLALVRHLTQRMGGRVGVESAPDQGSRFWVELRTAD
ncbi:MAG: sensor histidine kinase [Limisphaerales bacterium]